MKAAHFISSSLLLLLLISGNGCTAMLWGKGDADHWPADYSNLRLFDSRRREDVLVVYNEESAHSRDSRLRAYWLYANESRVAKGRAPEFTGTNKIARLTPVPIFAATAHPATNAPAALYAVTNDSSSFTLYSGDQSISDHTLPVYDAGPGTAARIALTPFTLAADAAVVTGVIVVLAELNSLDHCDGDGFFGGGGGRHGESRGGAHVRSPDGHHDDRSPDGHQHDRSPDGHHGN